ncbi:MAG: long-chain fatty acid--CoA ligase [Desulfobacteraceae bacterium]|nr:MAG: long-chain fatty acid--CoA ligase [Desulfobacteraceae bacterium]
MQSHESNRLWLDTYPEWLPADIETPEGSILEAFLRSADHYPNAPCIHYFDHSYSYRQIRQWSLRLAGALEHMAVLPGDRVMLIMQNIPQAVIACLAVWMRRAVVVPLNPMFTGADLKHYLDDCGAELIICQDDLYPDKVALAVQGRDKIRVVTSAPIDLLPVDAARPAQFENLHKLSFDQTLSLLALIAREGAETTQVLKPAPEDLAYLVYTSGTTGPAKGALIRHANVMHNAVVYEKACRLDHGDVVLGVAPLFHITGIVGHVAIAFHLGIPIILAARFEAGETLRLIQKYGATFTVAAITVYIALLNHPRLKQYDLTGLQKAYSGGAPVSPATVRKFYEAMHLTIYNIYGLTESASPATVTPLGMTGPVDEQSGALSVGLVIPGHDAWIVDLDDPSRELPPGQEGELVLKGPGITDGYWQKPEETAKAIRNGRLHTGDVAKLDEQGWCYIVDRKKDLINVSGFKVWPREVEDVLYRHPAVKEAAVVGVPDDYRGETVKAFVSLTEEARAQRSVSPALLIAFCKERMAAYKYPRIVEIIDELPKTLTGKFLRRQLRGR